ncbi:MAG: hypothetical protein FWD60_02005 [Candidatus Azobacteroides sp.]|nr:hypothetical protein [Candidatus Azobacteroides sp.]
MDTDLFDKKISELLTQNEDRLPSFANKEMVWKNIESKLQKSRRIKLFYFAALSAVASVVLVLSFTFLFHSEHINENETKTVQAGSKEIVREIHENEQPVTKKDSVYTIREKRKVEKPVKKNPVVTKETKEEDTVADAFIPVDEKEFSEAREPVENIVSQPNELSVTIPKNDIRVRVSLSPGKQENAKKEKMEFRFSNAFLANNEDNVSIKNVEENRIMDRLIRIPLK